MASKYQLRVLELSKLAVKKSVDMICFATLIHSVRGRLATRLEEDMDRFGGAFCRRVWRNAS